MNTVRSVMAAAILRHLAGRRLTSLGGREGRRPRPLCHRRDGRDRHRRLAAHAPHTLRDLHDTSFDLIVTLSPEAHHQALELTRTMAVDVEYWPTLDATMMLGHGSREQVLAVLPRRARPAVRRSRSGSGSKAVRRCSFASNSAGDLCTTADSAGCMRAWKRSCIPLPGSHEPLFSPVRREQASVASHRRLGRDDFSEGTRKSQLGSFDELILISMH